MTLQKLTLVLGGAASGKSAFAEELVLQSGLRPTYVATAQAFDDEMAEKIALHRASRGDLWRTVEAPCDLSGALAGVSAGEAVLIDCATLWLTNVILAGRDWRTESDVLVEAITASHAPIVIVSNEVGAGIVPETALGRQFRAAQGALNQRLAAKAGLAVAVMAGLPVVLKGALP